MSKIDEIKRYIDRTGISHKTRTRYDLTWDEWAALRDELFRGTPALEALYLAYTFGRARGYRAGRKSVTA